MKVGDIVTVRQSRISLDLRENVKQGIIIRQLPDFWLGSLEVFEVMTDDGIVETYTSAAISPPKRV